MTTLDHARRYLEGGISVVPVKADGTKAPALASWKEYQGRLATPDEAAGWWAAGTLGLGAVCGMVSGGLEVLDFDVDASLTFPAFSALVGESFDSDLFERLCVVETPRRPPGRHVWFRWAGPVPGNAKLAMLSAEDQAAEKEAARRERRKANLCLIETRGEGGYALVPGCPDACHENRAPYVHVSGPALWDLPRVTADERECLMAFAHSLNREAVAPEAVPKSRPGVDLRPGDDFDRRGDDWAQILEPHGWTLAGKTGDERRWARPGKKRGWSATTGHCSSNGADLFRCFTSSAEGFDEGKSYGKFRAFAILNCAGDLSEAAKQLRQMRYGSQQGAPPPPKLTQGAVAPPTGEPPQPIVRRLADVEAEPVRWLWQSWLPLGELCILDGDPGLGKSSLTLDLAARLSRGEALPPLDGKDLGRAPWATLLLGAEDSLSHTVRPRLDAMGADCALIHSLEGMIKGGEECPVILPRDLERTEDFIRANGVRLVVIDPLMAFLGSETDAHKDQDVRRCLRPLSKLAGKLDVVILLVRHLNKLAGGPALYRGGSSIGITGAARASLIVGRDPLEDRHVLAMNKINLGPNPPSLAYRVLGAGMACKIVWDGAVELRPDQILGHGTPGPPQRKAGRPADALALAKQFLADALAGGPVPTAEVMRLATERMIADATLKRARADLGVTCRREGKVYVMELPRPGGTQNFDPPGAADGDEDASDNGILPYDDSPF